MKKSLLSLLSLLCILNFSFVSKAQESESQPESQSESELEPESEPQPVESSPQEPVVVLTANATSSAPGSAPITCLLDPNCKGTWSPGSADSGVDEGIFIQLEKPVPVDYIEIRLENPTVDVLDHFNAKLYINGKTRKELGSTFEVYQRLEGGLAYLREGEPPPSWVIYQFGGRNTADPIAPPLGVEAEFIFIKLNRRYDEPTSMKGDQIKVSKIRLFQNKPTKNSEDIDRALTDKEPSIPLLLPKTVEAKVSATSVLSPSTAYAPAFLFDGKPDYAWATDGKKNSGVGESFTLSLNNPQTITGFLVWNGYQRSETHLKANSRVLKVELKSGSGETQTVTLKDQIGPQKITLATPLKNVSELKWTIREVAPGSSYKDVVISEIKPLDETGRIIAPAVKSPGPIIPEKWQGLLSRSFSSFLQQPILEEAKEGNDLHNFNLITQRIRLRANGTFVIYKWEDSGKTLEVKNREGDVKDDRAPLFADVLEGNWEPKGDQIRIFGKKYPTLLIPHEYLQEPSKRPTVAIFQSDLTLKRYAEMGASERKKLLDYLWMAKHGPKEKAQKATWTVFLGETLEKNLDENFDSHVSSDNYEAVLKKMDEILLKLNPYYIHSPVFEDLVIPTDQVRSVE